MKHLLVTLAAVIFCTLAWGAGKAEVDGPTADELVPWPWGTECKFPWNNIEGDWMVRGKRFSRYDRHSLVFETAQNTKEGKILYIYHFDEFDEPMGQGTGYADKDNKLIKAIMTHSNGRGRGYEIIVRAYSVDPNQKGCAQGEHAMAVTFCPRNGKRCLEDSNYLLER